MCFSWLWHNWMWFCCSIFCAVEDCNFVPTICVVAMFTETCLETVGFLGKCTSFCIKSQCKLDFIMSVNEDFPPQSFSSGHSRTLPIGIILSFVLLTSMKLPSLSSFCSISFSYFVLQFWGLLLTQQILFFLFLYRLKGWLEANTQHIWSFILFFFLLRTCSSLLAA